MHSFSYARPREVEAALHLAQQPGARFIAGGTNLLDLMKGGVEEPSRLIDISRIGDLAHIGEAASGGLRIGALATNADTAAHPAVRDRYPLLAQAILAGASPQLRNMASAGGNLLQRTRCPFFYDTGFHECNKRDRDRGARPAAGSTAISHPRSERGLHRRQSLRHVRCARGPRCRRADPLVAREPRRAGVRVSPPAGPDAPIRHGLGGGRNDRRGGSAAQRDGEAFVFLKIRDRASYAFALVSVAAALDLDDAEGRAVEDVRLVIGGVAHKPWRVAEARELLVGKRLDARSLAAIAEAAASGAQPYRGTVQGGAHEAGHRSRAHRGGLPGPPTAGRSNVLVRRTGRSGQRRVKVAPSAVYSGDTTFPGSRTPCLC